MPETAPVIVWYREDLRLADHPALSEAASTGAPLICVYVLNDKRKPRAIGAASRWWLAQSLRALASDLAARAGSLVLRRGDPVEQIAGIAAGSRASAVYWNRIYTREDQADADLLAKTLNANGIAAHDFPGDLLAEPSRIRGKNGSGMRVFTPFWKRVLALGDPPAGLPVPHALTKGPHVKSDSLDDWGLEPTGPDWAGGLRASWTPGESGARAALKSFLDGKVSGYSARRDYPDQDATSRLSPHLRFGEIGPRQVFHAARFAADKHPDIRGDIEKFLSELGWREFCRHLLSDYPEIHKTNLQPSFDDFPWNDNAAALRAWQRGKTGYPVVDAGMRQMWRTGVMHNRVRMVVASFLVKHLLIDWRQGEEWFWDCLVDADPGSNPANWQWVAGCGADAAPYFRIFNPILQGEKFDPEGDYVRRWVPELAQLSSRVIHRPWEATPMELSAAGITLGRTYPEPIIDHRSARARALAAYAKSRG